MFIKRILCKTKPKKKDFRATHKIRGENSRGSIVELCSHSKTLRRIQCQGKLNLCLGHRALDSLPSTLVFTLLILGPAFIQKGSKPKAQSSSNLLSRRSDGILQDLYQSHGLGAPRFPARCGAASTCSRSCCRTPAGRPDPITEWDFQILRILLRNTIHTYITTILHILWNYITDMTELYYGILRILRIFSQSMNIGCLVPHSFLQ